MLVETAKINKQEVTVVSSLDIAETFGKEHYHVLRDIRELECSEEFRQSNFGESNYLNEQNHKQPMYYITRDGFTLLAMGYTGEKAMKFKEAYIKQFNVMERMLQGKLIEREKGIAVRQSLTKALQQSTENERMHGHAYSNYTNCIYKVLFGMNAKQLREHFGISSKDDLTATAFLSDSENISKSWRQLLVLFKEKSDDDTTGDSIADIAAKIEALEGKMFFANVDADSEEYTETSALNYKRTVLFYCDASNGYVMPVAALVGETAGREPGSFTYKNLILKGIQTQKISDSQIDEIHQSGGITFVTKAGDNVTSEGIVTSGEYIDIIDSEDYIIQQLTYQTQKLLNSSSKVPYDNNGIAMLESAAVNVLQTAYNNGIIAKNEDGKADYTVNYGLREGTSVDDRNMRRYIGGNFSFVLAGAIHTVEIIGEITI